MNTFPNNTCICVPSGRCNTQQLGNTDGSGLIDIRILNSVSNPENENAQKKNNELVFLTEPDDIYNTLLSLH